MRLYGPVSASSPRGVPARSAGTCSLFFLRAAAALGLGASDERFDPEGWLRQHGLGKLTVTTPQSGKPLQPLEARSRAGWEQERRVYERAYIELVGTWPSRRPPLNSVVQEEQAAGKWTRFKVSFTSLPS